MHSIIDPDGYPELHCAQCGETGGLHIAGVTYTKDASRMPLEKVSLEVDDLCAFVVPSNHAERAYVAVIFNCECCGYKETSGVAFTSHKGQVHLTQVRTP